MDITVRLRPIIFEEKTKYELEKLIVDYFKIESTTFLNKHTNSIENIQPAEYTTPNRLRPVTSVFKYTFTNNSTRDINYIAVNMEKRRKDDSWIAHVYIFNKQLVDDGNLKITQGNRTFTLKNC